MDVALLEQPPAGDVGCWSDDELIESMVAARRLASQARAVELAAVAELARRRYAADKGSCVGVLSPGEYVHDEVAAALTVTEAAADDLIRFAVGLAGRLPGTFAALRSGAIDDRKARAVWYGTDQLAPDLVAAIEAAVLPKAATQTTGQIRAKIRRLVNKLDPDAVERRRTAAEPRRAVQLIATDDGTAHLNGTDLPAEAASAAYHRLTAIATAVKNDGDPRSIDQLRADIYLALLRGTQTPTPNNDPGADVDPTRLGGTQAFTPDNDADPTRLGGIQTSAPKNGRDPRADVYQALPGGTRASTRSPAGLSPTDPTTARRSTVDVPGWSPADDGVADAIAQTARAELSALAGQPPHHRYGAVILHAGERIKEALAPLKTRWCVPDHDRIGYRPPAAIRRLIEQRDRRCCFPGCRRPLRWCDADHSAPYEQGGPTCPCNLALLCRRHHQLKQTRAWRIEHIWPGVIFWITPTGHWSITAPSDRE